MGDGAGLVHVIDQSFSAPRHRSIEDGGEWLERINGLVDDVAHELPDIAGRNDDDVAGGGDGADGRLVDGVEPRVEAGLNVKTGRVVVTGDGTDRGTSFVAAREEIGHDFIGVDEVGEPTLRVSAAGMMCDRLELEVLRKLTGPDE